MGRRPRYDSDEILSARLVGTAKRLVDADTPHDQAVADLRTLAGRSARGPVLLAEEAGLVWGWYAADSIGWSRYERVVGLLLAAGADPDQVAQAFELGRWRRSRPQPTAPPPDHRPSEPRESY